MKSSSRVNPLKLLNTYFAHPIGVDRVESFARLIQSKVLSSSIRLASVLFDNRKYIG